MSEFLRFQQRQRQIHEQADRHNQTHHIVEKHRRTSFQSIAPGDVAEADDEEHYRYENEHHVEHE